MAKWVVRKSLDGTDASEPRLCTEFAPHLKNTRVVTVDDCVQKLLGADESLGAGTDRRPILRGDQLVGFVDVTDVHP